MQQFFIIFNLEWLLFKNSLRLQANKFELIARIIFGIAIFLFDIGVAVGFPVLMMLFFTSQYIVALLTMLFSGIMIYWQAIPLLTASFGGNALSVSRFRLYPITRNKLFLLDLFSGLTRS